MITFTTPATILIVVVAFLIGVGFAIWLMWAKVFK